MKLVITAAGSRGDIAPYTGLGARLREAGHEVTLATHEGFAPLVRAAGLDFRSLPGDPRGGPAGDRRQLMATAAAFARKMAAGLPDAVPEDTEVLLLSTSTAPFGWHLAEATGVRSLGVYLQPTTPTGDFPPTVGGTRSLGRLGNRAMGRFSLRMVDRLFADAVHELRRSLGLPPAAPGAVRRRLEADGWPVLHGFSSAVVPRPRDWRPGLAVTGNWWPHHAESQLPCDIEDFLAAGPPPVFVGFGSMATGEGERLGELAASGLRKAGLRGVLQAGSAGLSADVEGDDLLTIGDVPHALLLPRCVAAVHHAGAGTAAAALRAGIPSVPVPVTADQPFWAARVAALGAATPPIPFAALTVEGLAAALARVTAEPSPFARAAMGVAVAMGEEDGAGAVLRALERC
ncbi:glycosyltransferase [Streptomyces orinoci]|uniref:Glycosyltransferase n=1 Tax=Streptomyces orinoci TaxID=67339 RepID=A0ABV3JX98_STRON|nr:glycosyltransferase [Streptomyces orinoci]